MASAALLALPSEDTKKIPQRIVSTAPSITELLFAVGAGDRVVGVTTYCRFPPEARMKPKIGDFASPSLEAILSQKPDLVIINRDRQDLKTKFEAFGLPLLILDFAEIEDIFTSAGKLASRLRMEKQGESLVRRIQNDLAEVRHSLRQLPRPRVLFLIGRTPGTLSGLYAVGPRSYLGQILEMAGAENIVSDRSSPYPKLSVEQLLVKNPDMVLDMSHGEKLSDREIRNIQSLWRTLGDLKAVRQKGIRVIESDIFLVPGPRLAEAVQKLAGILHGVDLK